MNSSGKSNGIDQRLCRLGMRLRRMSSQQGCEKRVFRLLPSIHHGREGMLAAGTHSKADIVVSAAVGVVGLESDV